MTDLEVISSRYLFAMARFSPVMLVPALTPFGWVPITVRTLLLLVVTALAVGGTRVAPIAFNAEDPMAFACSLFGEAALGLTLSLAVVLPAAALAFSARLVDIQSGVGSASLFNPALKANESLAGTAMQWAGMMIFFALGLHVLLIRGLTASIELVPLGSGNFLISPGRFFDMLSSQFLLGMVVVAPVILGLFAVDLAVAYMSRSLPQANVYFVSLPLKVAAGFVLLAFTLRFAPVLIERLYRDAFSSVPAFSGA